MSDDDRRPIDETDAVEQHLNTGPTHQNLTAYTGPDGYPHAHCQCGWDSTNWNTQ